MSFDINLTSGRYRATGKLIEGVCPFTNEKKLFPERVGSLTPGENKAVRAVFERGMAASLSQSNPGQIEFAENSSIVVYGMEEEDCSHITIETRGLTLPIAQFLYDMADAGNMVIRNSGDGGETLIVVRAESLERELEEHEILIVCRDAQELGEALAGGFAGWAKYRDQVMGLEGEKAKPEPGKKKIQKTKGTAKVARGTAKVAKVKRKPTPVKSKVLKSKESKAPAKKVQPKAVKKTEKAGAAKAAAKTGLKRGKNGVKKKTS